MADTQLRKGVLELIVLRSLHVSPGYGGALLERLNAQGLEVSSGTLYPLLARLKKAGYLTSRWEESPSGPPRKVYVVTDAGRTQLATLTAEWQTLTTNVDTILKGQ
ncbi:PadR family transcriptional regulator [Corynebacterium sp. SA-MJD20WY100]|uniref:PadR family transcriptional regulator n=1 Tax=Corynebacterium sp. SA-MJD20WY100 TaxID=3142969 RepID=UPI003221C28D